MKRQDLVEALEIVKPGLASNELLEQTTSFAFSEGNVYTYNDEISISHPVEGLEDFEGAIEAEHLYKFLKRTTRPGITLTPKKESLLVKSGRAQAGLHMKEEIKLPIETIKRKKKNGKIYINQIKHA